MSDKSIVKFDGAMMATKNGLYDEYKFNVYDQNGEVETVGFLNFLENLFN